MLTLAISGTTATISGSSGGSVTVYTQAVTGDVGAGVWADSGNRVGDGTLALAPTPALTSGFYFAYAVEGAVLSGIAYFQVSDSLDSVQSRLFNSAKATMQLLSLPCTAHIYDSQFANTPLMQYPCVVMTTERSRLTSEADSTNGRDEIGHPIRLFIKDVVLKFDDARRETYRRWSQAIIRCFIGQRMPGVIESIRNKIEFGDVAAVESASPQVVCEITVRAITREVRGVGA